MAMGIMKVKLIGAKGLKRSDFFGKIDPYVVIQYRNEERRSSTAKGQGRRPLWNEEFKFRVEYPAPEGDDYQNNHNLSLRIFDRDTCKNDDYLGHSTVHLNELFEVGLEKGKAELGTQKYRVVLDDLTYYGELKVAITFTVQAETNQPKYMMDKRQC